MLRRSQHNLEAGVKALPILSGSGWIEGYASVYGNVDLSGEVITRGCFAKSIKKDIPAGAQIDESDGAHGGDMSQCIGTVTSAKEDSYGLYIHAELSSTQDAQDARQKVVEGHIKFMSVGFQPKAVNYRDPSGPEEEEILQRLKICWQEKSSFCLEVKFCEVTPHR